MPVPRITVSVVSHRQNALVNGLLADLARLFDGDITIILTQNVPDSVPFATAQIGFPVEILRNDGARGFGANHNAAFSRCRTPYFCVCNPDIRMSLDPFPALLQMLADPRIAVAGPLVRNPGGGIEDSVRRFPTATSLLRKLLSGTGTPEYPTNRGLPEVDWLAGMFMLFKSDAYRSVGGFDEGYFLYYEDVDICYRLHLIGKATAFDPRAEVTHDARRASRRDLRLALHHLASLSRFLLRRGLARGT